MKLNQDVPELRQSRTFPFTMWENDLASRTLMPKKSKGFRDLLKQNQQASDYNQKALNNFEQRFKQGSFGGKVAGVVQNPKGQVKMSEVLEDFMEPYLKDIDGYAAQYTFIELAVIAWNLAVMSEETRQSARDELLSKLAENSSRSDLKELDAILGELIDRKLKHFPNNHRLIMDFQFEDAGDRFHLSVASTMAPSPQK
jgi:hypothetical protein